MKAARTTKKKVNVNDGAIREILDRGVIDVIPKAHVEKLVASGKQLRVKLGIDPSGPDLHLGHAVALRKLRQFQQAGHHVVIIIGDWTARIGDPTGKNEMRPQLTAAQVKKNAAKYLKQIFLILEKEKTEVVWQSKWFDRFTLQDVINLVGKFTVAQLLDREDFRERQKSGTEIGYHEPMYSLLQAYDSVMVKADIEIGATEQLFNILKGRDVQQLFGQQPQGVITTEILIGLDGARKMGKSLNNYIALLDTPNDMYGKVMSVPDSLLLQYFQLCTDEPEMELKEIERQLVSRTTHPRDLKMRLARAITALYHGNAKASAAEASFVQTFQKREVPDDIATIRLSPWPQTVAELLLAVKLATSATEARRLVMDGGVSIDGAIIRDPKQAVPPTQSGLVIRKGKRHFRRAVKA